MSDIASRYGLIPIGITQDNLLDYISSTSSNVHLTSIGNIESLIGDKGASSESTASILSYMSPYMPTKRLGIFHSTGTGKTRKALLTAMQYDRDITVVAVHSVQLLPFNNELTPGSIVSTLHPGFRRRVEVMTCKSVVKAMENNDVSRLDYFFKDRVIVVDEMHHVRNSGDKHIEKLPMFRNIASMLSMYKNSIVLFLSATPLVDTSSELVGVHCLLKGEEPTNSNTLYMAHSLKGYVSKLTKNNLPMDDIVVHCNMEATGEQWRLYQKHQDDRSSVYSKTSAISRFITNDDAEATECLLPVATILNNMQRGISFPDERTKDEHAIECLKYLSVKMYKLVIHLLSNRGYPKFIYDVWKKRGGINRILDVLTMPAIGYTVVSTEAEALDTSRDKKLIVLHQLVKNATSRTISSLLGIFNSMENRDGSLIELVLASPQFSESMSFKTARECHIMSVLWNKTSKEQVAGRINRRSSLWYEPKTAKLLRTYNYLLCRPDGSSTVESKTLALAITKYREIIPVLEILESGKIETVYKPGMHNSRLPVVDFPINDRINNRARVSLPTLTYRLLMVNTSRFLEAIDHYPDLYTLMSNITSRDTGYNKMLNVAIQSIEQMYIARLRGEILSPKRLAMLNDVAKAFISYSGFTCHILYFTNNDTVEYQRLASVQNRIVRVLDTTTYVWNDVNAKQVVDAITDEYENIVRQHVEKIEPKWAMYGCYPVKYILPPCYRLVAHKPLSKLSRNVHAGEIDKRKVSRGLKYQYDDKTAMIQLLSKLIPLTPAMSTLLHKRASLSRVFNMILHRMTEEGMLLTMPI